MVLNIAFEEGTFNIVSPSSGLYAAAPDMSIESYYFFYLWFSADGITYWAEAIRL